MLKQIGDKGRYIVLTHIQITFVIMFLFDLINSPKNYCFVCCVNIGNTGFSRSKSSHVPTTYISIDILKKKRK